MIRSLALPVLALSFATAAHAGGIEVTGAWSRPAAPGLRTGVAYMTLINTGRTDDRLLGAASPKAVTVSLHRSAMAAGGVMTMEPVAGGLDLPPGRPVAVAPGGLHLMLEGLKGGLASGARYPLTLRFAHSAPQTVQVEVRAVSDKMGSMPMR